jgi:hypothetical protein
VKTSEGGTTCTAGLQRMTWHSTDFAAEKIRIQIATRIDYIFSRNSCTLPSEENTCIDYRYIEKYSYIVSFRGKTHTRTTDSHSER